LGTRGHQGSQYARRPVAGAHAFFRFRPHVIEERFATICGWAALTTSRPAISAPVLVSAVSRAGSLPTATRGLSSANAELQGAVFPVIGRLVNSCQWLRCRQCTARFEGLSAPRKTAFIRHQDDAVVAWRTLVFEVFTTIVRWCCRDAAPYVGLRTSIATFKRALLYFARNQDN
jgi:hypothetical protein